MYLVKRTPAFDEWMRGIRDSVTQKRLATRLRKAQLGNLGDVKLISDGVFEMREHFGPGWRMYYLQRGAVLIVMLGGGAKSSQESDIASALALAVTLED